MIRFTADEAFDADEVGEPILMTPRAAVALCDEHGADFIEFIGAHPSIADGAINAATLLAWLGY